MLEILQSCICLIGILVWSLHSEPSGGSEECNSLRGTIGSGSTLLEIDSAAAGEDSVRVAYTGEKRMHSVPAIEMAIPWIFLPTTLLAATSSSYLAETFLAFLHLLYCT